MSSKSHYGKILLLATASLGLHACGGGSSDTTTAADTSEAVYDLDLSGSVGDGPVAGAQLTVRSSQGDALQNLLSSQSAGYAVLLKTKGKYYPLLVEATGGTDLVTNLSPDFTLTSAVPTPRNQAIANLNPFTTLAISTAKQMPGGLTGNDVQSALATVVAEFNSGLTTLVGPGPMSTEITDSNVAEIVKSSETLAEIFRRTSAAIVAGGRSSTASGVIDKLGADLVDGRFDALGGSAVDPSVSAVAKIVSAQVLVEAMTNTLRVNGQVATTALDKAINTLASKPVQSPTASLPVTADMIELTKVGVAAAMTIAPSSALTELQTALGSLTDGMLPRDVAAVLPSGASSTLDAAITQIGSELPADVQVVNATSTAPTTTSNSPPTLSGTPPTSVTVGQAYAFTPTATDANNDALVFSIGNKPPWASFSTGTGALTGTPVSNDIGTYANIQISVSDGTATASLPTFSITVVAAVSTNRPPTISGQPATTALQGTAYRFQPTATDPDGDALTFSVANSPSWASFDTANGTLSGTPGAGDVGTYANIAIAVSDGQLSASLPAFSVAVQALATGSATLSWSPPTANTDGSALLDLAGYKVYWGTASHSYSNSVQIDNPGLSSYVVEGLAASSTYYFAVTAVNSLGVESTLSNEASKTLP
jgi:hypothetical protein